MAPTERSAIEMDKYSTVSIQSNTHTHTARTHAHTIWRLRLKSSHFGTCSASDDCPFVIGRFHRQMLSLTMSMTMSVDCQELRHSDGDLIHLRISPVCLSVCLAICSSSCLFVRLSVSLTICLHPFCSIARYCVYFYVSFVQNSGKVDEETVSLITLGCLSWKYCIAYTKIE